MISFHIKIERLKLQKLMYKSFYSRNILKGVGASILSMTTNYYKVKRISLPIPNEMRGEKVIEFCMDRIKTENI